MIILLFTLNSYLLSQSTCYFLVFSPQIDAIFTLPRFCNSVQWEKNIFFLRFKYLKNSSIPNIVVLCVKIEKFLLWRYPETLLIFLYTYPVLKRMYLLLLGKI